MVWMIRRFNQSIVTGKADLYPVWEGDELRQHAAFLGNFALFQAKQPVFVVLVGLARSVRPRRCERRVLTN